MVQVALKKLSKGTATADNALTSTARDDNGPDPDRHDDLGLHHSNRPNSMTVLGVDENHTLGVEPHVADLLDMEMVLELDPSNPVVESALPTDLASNGNT